jgi:hypothetical protein
LGAVVGRGTLVGGRRTASATTHTCASTGRDAEKSSAAFLKAISEKNRERYNAYMRQYRKGRGEKLCRLPEGYFQ